MTEMQTIEAKAQRRFLIISGQDNLAGLRRYLGPREPKVIKAALKLWRDQSALISKEDADRMVQTGSVPDNLLRAWEQQNSDFVHEVLVPEWIEGFEITSNDIEQRIKRLQQKALLPRAAIQKWVNDHKSGLITALNKEGKEAIAAVLKTANEIGLNPYQIGLLLRSPIGQQGNIFIGLFPRWAKAVTHRYWDLCIAGFSNEQAWAQSLKYKEFLTKIRGLMIARTELSEAYNEGQLAALRETGETVKKQWATGGREPCLKICAPLDGEERDLNAEFSCGKQRPPAHPNCGCTLEYELVR